MLEKLIIDDSPTIPSNTQYDFPRVQISFRFRWRVFSGSQPLVFSVTVNIENPFLVASDDSIEEVVVVEAREQRSTCR